jgi:hypothetical protein
MILPQTDHAMIPIDAAALLTQAENAFVTSRDITIVWTPRLVARAKSSRDQRNQSQVRNVRLAVSYSNSGGRLKSAPFPHFHRVDAAFWFLFTTQKEMCR